MIDHLMARSVALLERWAGAVEPFWHGVVGDATMGCYGPGYIHWGVQSNWNYAAAMATLSRQALSRQPGVSDADHWRSRALSALRFALTTHVTGDRTGNDGRHWGHSWISQLGIERGMHGVPLLAGDLRSDDQAALRRLLVSEADWLLNDARRGEHTGVVGGLWASSGCNVPESNIWSGALLWRVAHMYADEANAAAWIERAHTYFINGISVPADAEDGAVVAGKPVSARHAGPNFFPNYALDHHGYLNIGYMAICMSNAAMLAFDMRKAGLPVPESLPHHQADLWDVLRRFIFGNGRLARIGGDSRVRYAYCQEYLLPSLLYAADVLGDAHALELADRQLALIEQEMAASADGTFYGNRMGHMRDRNPHYFTRLESDRACVLSMAVNYLPLVTAPPEPAVSFESSVAGGWCEPDHGAVTHRSSARLASFAWRARGLTQGLCLPPSEAAAISSAEWALNLAPVVRFLGDEGDDSGKHRRLLRHHIASFPGGFATCGAVMEGVDIRVDEGAQCTDQALTHLAFAALPDGRTCVGLQLVVAADDRLGCLTELKGLHLNVANDCFNEFTRVVRCASGEIQLISPPRRDETLSIGSTWLSIDDVIGVRMLYGSDGLVIDRSRARRGGKYASLHVEEVCSAVQTGLVPTQPGQILIDTGFAVLGSTLPGGTAAITGAMEGGRLDLDYALVRGAWVDGVDGRRYVVVANFSDAAASVAVFGASVEIPPGTAVVRSV